MNKQEVIKSHTEKEDTPNPNTREAAAKRQAKIDKDVAEFLAKGGKVKK